MNIHHKLPGTESVPGLSFAPTARIYIPASMGYAEATAWIFARFSAWAWVNAGCVEVAL